MDRSKEIKKFYVIGLNYKKADVSTRSKFSLTKENQKLLLKDAKKSGLKGVIVLSTCNRVEIMGFAYNPYELIFLLCKYSDGTVEEFAKVSYVYKDREAAKHIITIATGIESQIIGDYEIVGQLKEAFTQAKNAKTINAYLERLLNTALQCSKEVKNNTCLSSGTTTVSYAAVQYIKDSYENLKGKNILVYGLGDIGVKSVKCCLSYIPECNVTVINRTDSKSFELASLIDVNAELHDNLIAQINKSDIVIVATGAPKPTITVEHVKDSSPQQFVDLSIPRNIDVEIDELNGKSIVDVDELSIKTEQTIRDRKEEIPHVEEIIQKYVKEFYEWLYFRKHTPAINSFKASLENLQEDVIHNYLKKHEDLGKDDLEEVMTQLVNKLVAKFAMHLKDDTTQATQSIKTINQIFKINAFQKKEQ
jgi:glutamyl-tRNA reductase